jgi:hypothetical protein
VTWFTFQCPKKFAICLTPKQVRELGIDPL